MNKYPLLLTIAGNIIVLTAAISGASAATLQPPVTIPDSIAPTDPTANPQNTNKAVSSIMSATGDANNSTLATGAAQADLSAKAGSSFNRMGAMNNMLSQNLIMGATANTIGLANLSQGENQAKHNALVQQRNLAEDEQKRVEADMDSLKTTYLEANKIKARARLCASSNICWI